MKFEDFFAPVLTAFVMITLLVVVYGGAQHGASDTEIAASVAKSVLEFQEQEKVKRRADLGVKLAEIRRKRESAQRKVKEVFSKMTPEQQKEVFSKMTPEQQKEASSKMPPRSKELFLGKKEGNE